METLVAMKEVVVAVSAAFAAGAAVLGLRTWQRQLHASEDQELARRLLRATYNVRDAFEQARAPQILAEERPEGAGPLDMEGEAEVFSDRYSGILRALREFDAEILEAEALWGRELGPLASPLHECTWEYRCAARRYAEAERRGQYITEVERRQTEAALLGIFEEWRDPITEPLAQAVEAVDEFVRPKLRRTPARQRWWAWIRRRLHRSGPES